MAWAITLPTPAIVGRIALAMGFASRMSTYGFPADATSTATPLASSEGIDYVTLLLGNHAASWARPAR